MVGTTGFEPTSRAFMTLVLPSLISSATFESLNYIPIRVTSGDRTRLTASHSRVSIPLDIGHHRSVLGKIRTCDLGFRKALHYPLCYEDTVPMEGIEPSRPQGAAVFETAVSA